MPATFRDHLQQTATAAVASIPADADAAGEIYVVSFLVDDEDDDPRRPTLTIGYNTETHVRQVLAARPRSGLVADAAPTDEAEARWNYAFWLQNRLAMIGDHGDDLTGAQLRDEWIEDNGMWFDEPTGAAGWAAIEPVAAQITRWFVELCVQLAKQLHANGLIGKVFGHSVPVLIHELEYYDAIADRAEAANPPRVVAAFADWIRAAGPVRPRRPSSGAGRCATASG